VARTRSTPPPPFPPPYQPPRPPARGSGAPAGGPGPERERSESPAPGPATAATAGELLRAARIRRRISLEQAERDTRIRRQYLQALEDDDLSVLPAGVYSRGFLRNYAIYLGIPPDEVLPRFRDRPSRGARSTLRSVSRPVRVAVPRSTWFILLAAIIVGLVLALLTWLGLTASDQTNRPPSTLPNGPAAGVTPTSLVTLPALPTAPNPTPVATTPPTPAASPTPANAVTVELRTTDRAWIRATVDGTVVLEDTLPAGQTVRWTGRQSVLLRVGNAGGVDVMVNGQRIGPLGPPNQPVDREFTR